MAGGSSDWEALINHQSSLLTETKNLVGKTEKMLEESKSQSRQNKWTLALVALTLLASIVLPFIVN